MKPTSPSWTSWPTCARHPDRGGGTGLHSRGELLGRVMDAARTLARGQQRRLERAAQRLDRAAGQLVSPAQRLEHQRERLNSLASGWRPPGPRRRRAARASLARATPGTSQARHARAAERVANAARQLGQAHARLRLQARNRLGRRRAAARAGSRQYAGAGICDCPRRAGTHPARCRQPAARTGAGVACAAARRPKSPRSGRSPTRPEQDAWSGPQAPGSTVSCKANTCCEKRLLGVAGLLAVGTIGMPAWAVSGADAAAPRVQVQVPWRTARCRCLRPWRGRIRPGTRLPVAIPRLSQGGNTRGAGLVRGRAGQRRGRVHGRPGRRAASRRLCRRRPAVAASCC